MHAGNGAGDLIYLRKSKGRVGIARQRSLILSDIARDGDTAGREFSDTDKTAFQPVGTERPDRPGFDSLIACIRSSPAGVKVRAYHADRLVRSLGDTDLLTTACAAGRHLVVTHSGGAYDLAAANGRRRLRDDASAAAYEVDHMTERVTAQKDEAIAAGLPLGGHRPFGWQHDFMRLHVCELVTTEAEAARRGLDVIRMTETRAGMRVLVMLPYSEAEALAESIRGVAAGSAPSSFAARWNRSGVRTSSGRLWSPHGVRRVILRPRNAGWVEHDGKIVGKGTWEPVIDDTTWRLACGVIRDSKGAQGDWTPKWLGSGIYRCGAPGCGQVMRVSGSGGGRLGYRCASVGVPGRVPDGIRHAYRAAEPLDAWVDLSLKAFLGTSGAIGRLRRVPAEHAAGVADLARIDGELLKLAGQAGEELITAEMLAVASAPLMARRRALAAAQAGQVPDIAGGAVTGEELWALLQADLGRKRAFLRMTLEVVVLPSPHGRPPGPLHDGTYFRPEYVKVTRKI
jgi:DNA invertase Pin-like site-specific DNA recombinase